MKESKIYLLQGNLFYSQVFKQNLHHLGYSDITIFQNASEMLEHSKTPPDLIIYDFDVDCFEGEKIVKLLTTTFNKARLLFSCYPSETHHIYNYIQAGAADCFIKDQHEMKSVADMLKNYCAKTSTKQC